MKKAENRVRAAAALLALATVALFVGCGEQFSTIVVTAQVAKTLDPESNTASILVGKATVENIARDDWMETPAPGDTTFGAGDFPAKVEQLDNATVTLNSENLPKRIPGVYFKAGLALQYLQRYDLDITTENGKHITAQAYLPDSFTILDAAGRRLGALRHRHAACGVDAVGHLWIQFPGSAPGDFDVTTTDGAMLWWTDINTGRYYYAQKNYLGVSGHIKIDRCAGDIVTGSFSGTLGYWDWVTHNPYADPPEETVTFTKGIIKYTGKIMASALGIGWPGGEAAMRLIGRAGGAAMAR